MMFLAHHIFLPTACKKLPPAALLQRWVLSQSPFAFSKKQQKPKAKGR